jgi:hypothetical protein
MEKVEQSPLAIAKKIFVLAKTSFVIYQTVKAAIAWRRSKKPMGVPAQLCLLFSALIVGSVCAYKFTSKEIKPLVTLQAMSHYLCFCILHVLLGYVECRKFEARSKILNAFKFFHVLWWAIIFFAYKTATCSKEDFYPDAFLVTNCFNIGIYVMVYSLHSKDYTLEWSEDESVAKNLFIKQSERYLSFYTFLIEWHLFELVLGKGLDSFTDSIMCGDEGAKWIYASGKGNLFMMLHIIGTMMGTGMARAVFIKTAKAEGFFGGVDEDSDEEEDTSAKKDSKKQVEPKKTK